MLTEDAYLNRYPAKFGNGSAVRHTLPCQLDDSLFIDKLMYFDTKRSGASGMKRRQAIGGIVLQSGLAIAIAGKAACVCSCAADGVGFVDGLHVFGVRVAVVNHTATSLDI